MVPANPDHVPPTRMATREDERWASMMGEGRIRQMESPRCPLCRPSSARWIVEHRSSPCRSVEMIIREHRKERPQIEFPFHEVFDWLISNQHEPA